MRIRTWIFYSLTISLLSSGVFIVSGKTPVNDKSFETAISFYKSNKFADAEFRFSKLTGYNARLAQAISAFKINKTDKALSLFMQSTLLADTDKERFTAIYNAATIYFLNSNFKQSAYYFNNAIRYNPTHKQANDFLQISLYLNKIIESRLASANAITDKTRAGRGNKSRKLDEVNFDREANLKLEDNDASDSETINTLDATLNNTILLEQLITAGIDAIELNQKGNSIQSHSFIDQSLQFRYSSIEHASFTSDTSVSDLWKRVFELEEGFPAVLETSETVDGLRPW